MERFTCRTCLSIADGSETFQVFEKRIGNKTIKDVLLKYVPSMHKTLSENDRICNSCTSTLKNFEEFIDKCMEIEDTLIKDDTNFEELGFLKSTRSDEAKVVENIQIVLDDELKSYFDQPSTSTDVKISVNLENIDHDHSYIKVSDETGLSLIKTESMDQDESQEAIKIPQDKIDEMSGLQFIPVGTVTDEMLAANMEVQNILGPNVTVLATGNQFTPSDFLEIKEIKEESNDSITGCESITLYQTITESPNIYVCELCGDGFLTEESLTQHLSLHGQLRIMCDKCPKVFKHDNALKAHYKLKHAVAARYKCSTCGQVFARADYLRNHIRRHEEERKNNIKCRVPGKFLRFKNSDDPLPCKICGKYYNGIQKLKVHLQTHLVVKRFACEYCDLTYKRWPSLKRHEKTHLESDTFFYRCNVCWKRFAQKEDLELHMNQHGNPRYRCQVCNEQFHRKYLFDNHYLLSHATPEDIENSKKEVIYDTLLELSSQTTTIVTP